MKELKKFPEISARLLEKLAEIGITTKDELAVVGAKQAWLKMYGIDPGISFNMLQVMESVVQGITKDKLSKDDIADLRLFFQRITKPIKL